MVTLQFILFCFVFYKTFLRKLRESPFLQTSVISWWEKNELTLLPEDLGLSPAFATLCPFPNL